MSKSTRKKVASYRQGGFKFFQLYSDDDELVENGQPVSKINGEKVYLGDVVRFDEERTENTFIAVLQKGNLIWHEPENDGTYIFVPSVLSDAPKGHWDAEEDDDAWFVIGYDPDENPINENKSFTPTEDQRYDQLFERADEDDAVFTEDEKIFVVEIHAREDQSFYPTMGDFIEENQGKMMAVCASQYSGKKPLSEALNLYASTADKMQANFATGLYGFVQIFGLQMLLCLGY